MAERREGNFSAAELIEALRERALKALRFQPLDQRPAGEFPPAWATWLETMGQRSGAIHGASEASIVAVFMQREAHASPRDVEELNQWQAFATLWRQQWQPPGREERRVRIAALVITFIVHVVFVVILLWLAYARFTPTPAPAGEEIVQVEYVGEGTPDEPAGGAGTADTSQPATPRNVVIPPEAQPADAASPPPSAAAQVQAPASMPPSLTPRPPSPAPMREQPLQVSTMATPDAVFVLPPPTPRRAEIPQAQITVPQLQAPTRDIELIEALPAIRPLQSELPTPRIQVPQLATEPRPIDAVTALPKIQPRDIPPRAIAMPAPRPNAPPVQLREASTPTPSPANSTTARSATPTTAGTSTASRGVQPAPSTSGSGPRSTAQPGAWPTPKRGDDWGVSTRNRPGGNTGKPGLLDEDGSPRLPSGAADADSGFPPGSEHWTRDQFDRAGTWLKRPPNDFTPTRFEKLWVPSETLLEEWVRKNIRSVEIPIPGTSKKLHCVVSLLQLGGGCGITDPDMNDQEAEARPPPDIPFKPDLQDDQDSLRKPGSP